MIFTRNFNAFVRGTSSQLPFVQWLVKGAMQNVTIYESFWNTIRQKISKLTSKLLSFSKRPRSKFYGSFSCSSFSCFLHSPYQPPLILLNYLLCLLCMFALFLYISRQRGKSVNLLFISSRLLLEFDVVTFTAKRRLLVLALTTPRTHLSKHLVTSNTDTEDCFHSWMAGFLLIILAYCHVLDKFVRALLSWSPPLNQGNLYQVFD